MWGMAAKLTDVPLIDSARREALALMAIDRDLTLTQHVALGERLTEFWRNIQGAGDVS